MTIRREIFPMMISRSIITLLDDRRIDGLLCEETVGCLDKHFYESGKMERMDG